MRVRLGQLSRRTLLYLLPLAALLWLRDRRQRNRVKERIFWVRTLLPVLHLQGVRLTEAVTKLTREPLVHPVHGRRCYRRNFVQRKLFAVFLADIY